MSSVQDLLLLREDGVIKTPKNPFGEVMGATEDGEYAFIKGHIVPGLIDSRLDRALEGYEYASHKYSYVRWGFSYEDGERAPYFHETPKGGKGVLPVTMVELACMAMTR